MYIYTYVYVSACDKKRSGLGSLSNMPERIGSEKLLVYTYTLLTYSHRLLTYSHTLLTYF